MTATYSPKFDTVRAGDVICYYVKQIINYLQSKKMASGSG